MNAEGASSMAVELLLAKADSMHEIASECRAVSASYSRQGYGELAASVDVITRYAVNREQELREKAEGGA